MGYRLKRLDEPVFMAGPKSMRTEFGIHQRLESCVPKKLQIFLNKTLRELQNADPQMPYGQTLSFVIFIYKDQCGCSFRNSQKSNLSFLVIAS